MVTIRAGNGGGGGSSDGDGMSWKDKVTMFTDEFIGTSEFAKSCVITNIDDISLSYNKKQKPLRPVAKNPSSLLTKNWVTQLVTFWISLKNRPIS